MSRVQKEVIIKPFKEAGIFEAIDNRLHNPGDAFLSSLENNAISYIFLRLALSFLVKVLCIVNNILNNVQRSFIYLLFSP